MRHGSPAVVVVALFSSLIAGFAAPGWGRPYKYELVGTGSGTINGISFANTEFTLAGFGDTDDLFMSPPDAVSQLIPLGSLTVTLAGVGAFEASGHYRFFQNPIGGIAGFTRVLSTYTAWDVFDFAGDALKGYDGVSQLAATSVTPYYLHLMVPIPTTDGQVIFSSAASLRFSVSAADAVALLNQLLADVAGVGPGRSLADKVALAQTYYAVPDVQATCAVLTDFGNEVRAQRGKKIAIEVADELTADAQAIMSAIGCE